MKNDIVYQPTLLSHNASFLKIRIILNLIITYVNSKIKRIYICCFSKVFRGVLKFYLKYVKYKYENST